MVVVMIVIHGDHTAITAVAAQSSNQPIMVVCIAHLSLRWHCKVTDMFVWITVMLLQYGPLSFFSTSDIIIYCARLIVWVYGPTKQQQSMRFCFSALLIINPRYLVVDS